MIKHTMALALTLTAVTLPAASQATTTVQPIDTDSSWTVTNLSDATTGAAFVPATVPGVYNGGSSNTGFNGAFWIYPNSSDSHQENTTFAFAKVFTLAAFNTAFLSGTFWSDNGIESIVLNTITVFSQTVTGNETTYSPGSGTPWTFSSSALQQGSNTLVFNVRNGPGTSGNPVALQADLAVTSAVPEPGTWMLMLLGFGAIGFAMRSRAKTQVRFQFA